MGTCGLTNTQRDEGTKIKREYDPLQAKEAGSGQLPPSQPQKEPMEPGLGAGTSNLQHHEEVPVVEASQPGALLCQP